MKIKTAQITAVSAGESAGYAWTWHCSSDNKSSDRSFRHYYDCMADARAHGYTVEPVHASGVMAPGGTRYALDGENA